MVDGKSKSLVAYHEVGHAVCSTLTPGTPSIPVLWLLSDLMTELLYQNCTLKTSTNIYRQYPSRAV